MSEDQAVLPFEGESTIIRRQWVNDRWYFSVVDVVAILTDSETPRRYWSDLKRKLRDEGFELYEKIVQLKMRSLDGKNYATDAADTETLLRIIQSIPSPKAEPFKQWLAKVGAERIEENGQSDLLAGMTPEQRAIFLRGQMADRNTSLADVAVVSGGSDQARLRHLSGSWLSWPIRGRIGAKHRRAKRSGERSANP
jgi:hypothetical protein